MKVIVDKPTDLKKVLEQHWGDLQNVRCFYIVEPLMERGQTIKFGIAGMSSGKPWDRLNEYRILYGDRTDENTAKGVTVHFVGITKYNRLVKKENTEIYKLERNLKKTYGSVTEPFRGSERISKRYLPQILEAINSKSFSDSTPEMRETGRPETKRYQDDELPFFDTVRSESPFSVMEYESDEEEEPPRKQTREELQAKILRMRAQKKHPDWLPFNYRMQK